MQGFGNKMLEKNTIMMWLGAERRASLRCCCF